MFDGLYLYTRAADGTLSCSRDASNDIALTVLSTGEIERLQGWPTPALRPCEDDRGTVVLVGCREDGRVWEINVEEYAQ